MIGCAHEHTSRIFHRPRSKEPYIVCVDCGGEFAYDLRTMRVGAEIPPTVYRPDVVALARAATAEEHRLLHQLRDLVRMCWGWL